MYAQMGDDGVEDIFLFFKVAKMTSPRLPAPETHFVPNLVKQSAITKLERSLVRIRCIAFSPPPPWGWRNAVRACEVEWSRSSGSCVTHGPDVGLHGHLVGLHPHISSSSAAARPDEELVAVDHKKNIRAMSRKEKKGAARRRNRGQVEEQVGRRRGWEMRAGLGRTERVRVGSNGSSGAPAVAIKQQVGAVIKTESQPSPWGTVGASRWGEMHQEIVGAENPGTRC